MLVDGKHYRTIWEEDWSIRIIDQRWLPHEFVEEEIDSVAGMCAAIADMHVRGAGLIGAAAGYGMHLGAREAGDDFTADIRSAGEKLVATRPTAVNLVWAVKRQLKAIDAASSREDANELTLATARAIADEDAASCKAIGEHGLGIIRELSGEGTFNILTHCNAGWLAFVDHGSAMAPIYAAHDAGLDIHVWVDETRPRNQGARLTAWELGQHGVPHTVIADNAGGHLMQHGMVDMVIVGTDRTTYTGDVANKVGTYLKALAARDNDVPFYVALPSSTFDWKTADGVGGIPIEERGADEVRYIQGLLDGKIEKVLLTPPGSPAANYAFDVTPARLVRGLITERGVCEADEDPIREMFPDGGVTYP